MLTGVSTSCLFPMLTEDALQHLLDQGVNTVELFLNSQSEAEPEFANKVKKMTDAAGASVVSVHPYSSEYEGLNFFGRYPRRFEDSVNEYKRYFNFCNIVGAEVLAFHGLRDFMNATNDFYFERFERLSDIAKSSGIKLCQENVSRCYSAHPEFLSEMKKAIPQVNFLFDAKQAVRAGHAPLKILELMGENTAHIHLSDHSPSCDCLPLGEGEFELQKFASCLRKFNYDGAIIIELYRWNFELEEQLAESEKIISKIIRND